MKFIRWAEPGERLFSTPPFTGIDFSGFLYSIPDEDEGENSPWRWNGLALIIGMGEL